MAGAGPSSSPGPAAIRSVNDEPADYGAPGRAPASLTQVSQAATTRR
jgi:hypothetical protein